jgi:Ca2+-binding RTX toxin-like protein
LDNDTLDGGDPGAVGDGDDDADTLNGGEGNDTLIGYDEGDTLNGDAGEDEASYATTAYGVDIIINGTDDDVLNAIENLRGSAFPDSLLGDAGRNTIWGGAGDDLIFGHDGGDDLRGEGDDDHIEGDGDGGVGAGFDASDTINGGAGDDNMIGGDSFDPHAALASDTMDGGSGNDILQGGSGPDVLFGNDGSDDLVTHYLPGATPGTGSIIDAMLVGGSFIFPDVDAFVIFLPVTGDSVTHPADKADAELDLLNSPVSDYDTTSDDVLFP